MSTEQKQDIHCGSCTVKGDMVACLATPCSVRSSWFANSQAVEIERLTGCLEKANIQAEKFEREWYLRGDEIDALKADAERYRWYVAQLESGKLDKLDEAFRNMERIEVVTKQMFDAAIDAMKGKS